jgi:hypothetical protein
VEIDQPTRVRGGEGSGRLQGLGEATRRRVTGSGMRVLI